MSQEKMLELEARIAALQFFVAQAFRQLYEANNATPEWVKDKHAKVKKLFESGRGIQGASDPAMSDHIADEIAESVDSILEDIEDAYSMYREADERNRGG